LTNLVRADNAAPGPLNLASIYNYNFVSLSWAEPSDDAGMVTDNICGKYSLKYATFPITDATWNDADYLVNEASCTLVATPRTLTRLITNYDATNYFFLRVHDESDSNVSSVAVSVYPYCNPPVLSSGKIDSFEINLCWDTDNYNVAGALY